MRAASRMLAVEATESVWIPDVLEAEPTEFAGGLCDLSVSKML